MVTSQYHNEKEFLIASFRWDKTKEGYDYWSKIYKLIKNGTIKLLPEEKKEEFVWTDELALEFSVSPYSTISPLRNGLEQFKASKQRNPLFTTEDGKQIFKGDVYWYVELDNNFDITSTVACSSERQIDECKDFSTEPAAREYVRLNKPMYSLNDIGDAWEKLCHEAFTYDQLITELEKLKP